jgi:4'-phosphopantetheinyl transferase
MCPPPTQPPILDPDEIHVWRARLDLNASDMESLLQTLSSDERSRAERFRLKKDHHRFVVARGILRQLLGGYLRVAPSNLRFRYGPFGKPFLITNRGKDDLLFNLAHAARLAVYAISHGRNVGVDLERVDPAPDWNTIAGSYFTPHEVKTLWTLPESARTKAFFDCWTRKEAYLKARGEGLSVGLDSFEALATPDNRVVLAAARHGRQEASRWTVQDILIDEGFSAALAVEGSAFVVRYWQWPLGAVRCPWSLATDHGQRTDGAR